MIRVPSSDNRRHAFETALEADAAAVAVRNLRWTKPRPLRTARRDQHDATETASSTGRLGGAAVGNPCRNQRLRRSRKTAS